jgi:cell division protein FtsZ
LLKKTKNTKGFESVSEPTPPLPNVKEKEKELGPKLTVIGIGGAGGNAVNNMIQSGLEGVNFMVCNTDAQALDQSLASIKIQLGMKITQGLGAGSQPDVGRAAAEESLDEVLSHLQGTNMIFITAGMGGGTGTGAGPLIAKAARDEGILTVGVVTKPFHFEGANRMQTADEGIEEMHKCVDTLLVIPNQNLFRLATENTTFSDAFAMADDVLYSGVRTFTDLMVKHGLINLDFADICAVMREMRGKAMMGTGQATGERRAIEAAEHAISCPLLDNDVSMRGARAVLINVTGGPDMKLFEVDEAANHVRDEGNPSAKIIFGATFDPKMQGELRVAVVATGIDAEELPAAEGSFMVTPKSLFQLSDEKTNDADDEIPNTTKRRRGRNKVTEETDMPREIENQEYTPKSLSDTLGRRHSRLDEALLLNTRFDSEDSDLPFKLEEAEDNIENAWTPNPESPPPLKPIEDTPPPKKRTFSLLERLGMRRSSSPPPSQPKEEVKSDSEPSAPKSTPPKSEPVGNFSPEEETKSNDQAIETDDVHLDNLQAEMPAFMRQKKRKTNQS